MSTAPPSSSPRIVSLDQFRGYTVAGMFVVNFLGGFAATPAILRHHNTYCSYADTIMPHFFFAVGFALRLVMLREEERHGRTGVWKRGVRRGVALALFGLIFYQLDGSYSTWEELRQLGWSGFFSESFRRSGFQTLTHIGVTSLWCLPVILRSARIRIAFAAASGLLHVALSHAFWYETLHAWRVIDGGLLGFLTWTIPTIAGSLAHDWVTAAGPRRSIKPLLLGGIALSVAGYAVSCLGAGGHWAAPPFLPPVAEVDLWTMSQRAGSLSYLVFAAGFSLLVYSFFVWWCDVRGGSSALFADLGQNAFAAYVLHLLLLNTMEAFGPRDAPLWYALAFGAVGFVLSWRMTRWCNDRRLFIRL